MLVGSSYDIIIVLLFFLSIPVWAAGVVAGHFLAVRSALRSRKGGHGKVFRGLAEPWGTKIARMKMFYVWFAAFLIPAVGFFPVHVWLQNSFLRVILYVPSLSFLVFCSFSLCCLTGFQRTILSAENFISTFVKPDMQPKTRMSHTTITVKRKEISGPDNKKI